MEIRSEQTRTACEVPSPKSLVPTNRQPSFSSAFPSTATPGNMAEVSDIKLFGKWSYDDVDVSDPPLPMPRSRPPATTGKLFRVKRRSCIPPIRNPRLTTIPHRPSADQRHLSRGSYLIELRASPTAPFRPRVVLAGPMVLRAEREELAPRPRWFFSVPRARGFRTGPRDVRDAALRSAASDAVVTCDDADRALDLTRASASVPSAERVAVELARIFSASRVRG